MAHQPRLPTLVIGVIGLAVAAGCSTSTTRVGQSTSVQFGVVSGAERVTLDSNAAQGALVGGMLGLASQGGSSSRRTRNAIVGASVGGAAAGAAEGSRTGMRYTVDLLDGSVARIVTDQVEIKRGDCVAVETAGQTANIRRAAASYCDPANRAALSDAQPAARAEASACENAKQQLTDAVTGAEREAAIRKIELLCNN